MNEQSCGWTQDSDGGSWATGCGSLFEITNGTPSENDMNFCCFCGRVLKETPFSEKSEE